MENKNIVIFIHGLGADQKDWWGSTEDSLRKNPKLTDKYDIRFFLYKTDKIKTIINDAKNKIGLGEIQASLDDLGKQLATYIKYKGKDANHIKLFGHSMGGLVIASALPELQKHELNIYNKISSVAFAGTPLGGSSVATIWKNILPLVVSKQTKDLAINSKELHKITAPISHFLTIKKQNNTDNYKKLLTFFRITDDEVVSKDEERYGIFYEDIRNYEPHQYILTGKHSESVQNLAANDQNFLEIEKWLLEDRSLQSIQNKQFQQDSLQKKITFDNFIQTYIDLSSLEELNIFAHTGKHTLEALRLHFENFGWKKIKNLQINLLLKSPLSEESSRYEQLDYRLKLNIKELQKNGILTEVRFYQNLPVFQSILCKYKSKGDIAYVSFYEWKYNETYRKTEALREGYLIDNPTTNILFQTSKKLFSHLFSSHKLHTLIFDFDDTIFNTFNIQINAWVKTLELMFESNDHNELQKYLNDNLYTLLSNNNIYQLKRHIEDIFVQTHKNEQRYPFIFKLSDVNFIKKVEELRFGIRQNLTKEAPLFKNIKETLEELSKEYFLVIISATTEEVINYSLEKHDIKKYFSIILGRDNKDYEFTLKEKSNKILKISNLTGIPFNRMVFIGDSTTDYEAAKQLGLNFVAVNIIAKTLGKSTLINPEPDIFIDSYENRSLIKKIQQLK